MKASVLVITYNQERFIAQAIDSALSQEVDFDYEIVIGEDCSTDGTRDILLDYQKRHPDTLRLLLHETNQGMNSNLLQTWESCRGEYTAILEGDDYWTSPHKLRKQVEFLEANPDFAECGHRVQKVDEQGNRLELFPEWEDEKNLATEDFIVENRIPTCSMVFRNRPVADIPPWFVGLGLGDWPLHMLNSCHGKIRYSPEVMGAYRVHSGSVWSSRNELHRLSETVRFFEAIKSHLNPRCHRPLVKETWAMYYRMMLEYEKLDDAKNADACVKKCIETSARRCMKSRPFRRRFYKRIVLHQIGRAISGKWRPEKGGCGQRG